jgi:hypothetical protein
LLSHTKEDYKFRVYEDRALKRIFGSKKKWQGATE